MSAVECVTEKCCPHGQEAEKSRSGLECHSPRHRHAVRDLQTLAVCSWPQRPVFHSCLVLRGFSDVHFAPYLENVASCFLKQGPPCLLDFWLDLWHFLIVAGSTIPSLSWPSPWLPLPSEVLHNRFLVLRGQDTGRHKIQTVHWIQNCGKPGLKYVVVF